MCENKKTNISHGDTKTHKEDPKRAQDKPQKNFFVASWLCVRTKNCEGSGYE